MTDITELAQSLKAAAEKASNGEWVKESGDGWEASCSANDQANGGFIIAHFEGPDAAENREFVQAANPANILALVEALEKAQSANAAQDDHINQQQDRIEQLEKGHQEAAKQITSWVLIAKQNIAEREKDIAELDAARQRIAELESRTVTVKLVDINEFLADVHDKTLALAFRRLAEGVREADIAALTAQGIKWEAE